MALRTIANAISFISVNVYEASFKAIKSFLSNFRCFVLRSVVLFRMKASVSSTLKWHRYYRSAELSYTFQNNERLLIPIVLTVEDKQTEIVTDFAVASFTPLITGLAFTIRKPTKN